MGDPDTIYFHCLFDMVDNPTCAKSDSGPRAVPTDSLFIIGGTSCRDASRASSKHYVSGTEAVRDGTGSTGTTFRALVRLKALMVPANGPALPCMARKRFNDQGCIEKRGTSNLYEMCTAWNEAGCSFVALDMERSTGGLPVRRPRTYMEARDLMWDEDWTRRIVALVSCLLFPLLPVLIYRMTSSW